MDNNGVLKIADFGLATSFDPDNQQPLTSRVATLWYRPPELLLGATKYGPSVDLWSAGCILAELLAGKPILPGRTEVQATVTFFMIQDRLYQYLGYTILPLCSFSLYCDFGRWSNFTKFSSSVDHLLVTIGVNWKYHKQGCSSPAASIGCALLIHLKIFHNQL
jgi:serine/threonine protein kinase